MFFFPFLCSSKHGSLLLAHIFFSPRAFFCLNFLVFFFVFDAHVIFLPSIKQENQGHFERRGSYKRPQHAWITERIFKQRIIALCDQDGRMMVPNSTPYALETRPSSGGENLYPFYFMIELANYLLQAICTGHLSRSRVVTGNQPQRWDVASGQQTHKLHVVPIY